MDEARRGQGGFEAWKGTPREPRTSVPVVTPYPAVSPALENERRRRQQAEAADEGVATPRPRAPPGLTVVAVRDALRILTRTPQRAALQRWRGAVSVLGVMETLRALNRIVPRAYLRRWRAAAAAPGPRRVPVARRPRRPPTPPAADRARGAAVLTQAARRREAQTTAERWRRWAQKPPRESPERFPSPPNERHTPSPARFPPSPADEQPARFPSHVDEQPVVRVGPRWPSGSSGSGDDTTYYAGASARAGAAALAAVAEKRSTKTMARALHEWRFGVARLADVAAGMRRLALLLSYQHRTSISTLFRRWVCYVAQFAIEVAATDRRRAAREVADAQLAVERAAADADEARAKAEEDADEARAKAGDEAAERLRRSHDVARRARRDATRALRAMTECEARAKRGLDLAIGRLKEAAATEQALKRERDASLARKAQLDDREKKVQALEARAKVVKRKLRGSKKADAARKAAADETRRRERALAVEQKRV
jgi:hypothetical protein